MNEGVFRVLRSLGHGREVSRTALVRDSGEAHSVLTALEKDKAKWFEASGESFRLSTLGLAAYGREVYARTPSATEDELVARLQDLAKRRPSVRRDLDQVHATLPSVAARARFLVERGHTQRGLLFFGDDDLTALAVSELLQLSGDTRKVTVLDIDERLAEFYSDVPLVEAKVLDLRETLPREIRGRFGCVFTDPPYAPEGFSLFVSRAIEALKPDGYVLLQSGHSRRSRERGLKKQRLLAEAGLLIEEVIPDFTRYDGAESVGATSHLHVCAMTPQSRPLPDLDGDAELYTRRAPSHTD